MDWPRQQAGAQAISAVESRKRTPVYGVVILSQAVGLTLLVGMALLLSEPMPASADLFWGGAAGIAGGLGLVALYQGLATGPMGIVSPVAAVVMAAVPVCFGIFFEGLPAIQQLAGPGLALVAVQDVSTSPLHWAPSILPAPFYWHGLF